MPRRAQRVIDSRLSAESRGRARQPGADIIAGAPAPPTEGRQAEAVLALQQAAGNHAVEALLTSRARGRELGRMQIVATDPGTVESDAIILMNIRHGLAVNQGRGVQSERTVAIGDPYTGDDLDIASDDPKKREIVFLHGHGSAGGYAGEFIRRSGDAKDTVLYSAAADEIASKLKTVNEASKRNKSYEIRVLTCHGADPSAEALFNAPSLVKALKDELATAPQTITIKGAVHAAFSYPGFKTYQEPLVGSADAAIAAWLKTPFDEFKAWLQTAEGAGSGYPERLSKLSVLLPEWRVKNFIKDLEAAGGYSKTTGSVRDAKTFVKEVTRTTA
jgi:hypothetical protein